MKTEVSGIGLNQRLTLLPENTYDAFLLGVMSGSDKIQETRMEFAGGNSEDSVCIKKFSFTLTDLTNALIGKIEDRTSEVANG